MALLAAHSAPATTITTTTETVAASVPAHETNVGSNNQGVVVHGVVQVTTGASTTAIVVKLRLGTNTITGTQIGTSQTSPATASVDNAVPFCFVDATPDDLASGYSITVTQTGAAGNGTVKSVDYAVDVALP